MCGICGRINFREPHVARDLVQAMCDRLVHRGPDAEGIHVAPFAGLAQRRLAIIDLDHRSVAPLSNEDGTVWVTFNGEIYNFAGIRARLLARGHTFRTSSDTEVLVHLYEDEGTEMVHALRGMFAFAIWDSRSRTLFAARDRLGKKPFFYAVTDEGLTFASEMSALLCDRRVQKGPDFAALDQYLTLQYVPAPYTAFADVRKLPAAHLLVCGADGRVDVRRYWRPVAPPPLQAGREEIEEQIVSRLREAVRIRLISDVPLGAFLSGGIDSAAVVALMAQESASAVKTFSIGLEDSVDDERPFARLLADRYGTEHHEFVVRPDAAALLPTLVRHYGEPFGDPSALPTFYLSSETRRHVTVALSGDGGDESFAGYNSYASVARWQRTEWIPRGVRRAVAAGFDGLAASLPYGDLIARTARAGAMLAGDTGTRYRLSMTTLKPQERRAAYTPEFREQIGDGYAQAPAEPWAGADALGWMMRQDQNGYLPDCLMVKVDIASMASSLEVRAPFLDHEFMEFAAAIPSALKHDGVTGKTILRSALRDLLPSQILGKRKTGFGIPVAHWFRTDLRAFLCDHLLDRVAAERGLFRPRFTAAMIDDHLTRRRDWSNRLWVLLMLELWFREFVDT